MTKPKNGVNSKKKQQLEVPGTQDPDAVEAIDDACADYLNGRATLLNQRKEVGKLKEGIIALMRANKRTRYVYRDGVYVFVFTTPNKTELHSKREHLKKDEQKRPKRARRGRLESSVPTAE